MIGVQRRYTAFWRFSKVPSAAEYIDKVRQRGSLGTKRKTIKC